MSRNTHHRQRDHFGTDFDTNVTINGAVGANPSGTNLHTVLESLESAANPSATPVGLSLVMDGGNNPITPGIKGDVEIPFACTILAARLFADQNATTVVDIWRASYAGFPPSAGGSICGGAKPSLSAAVKSQNTFLIGWTTAIAAGDILRINVDSNSNALRLTLALTLQR